MSVVSRLEDAELLLRSGRAEGAILQVIVAIAGTSRTRYSKSSVPQDGEAFRRFFDEELRNVAVPMQFDTPRGPRSLGSVLYEVFRNSLVHEAALSTRAGLCPDPRPGRVRIRFDSVDPIAITISHSAMILLVDLVARAPENANECAEVRARIMATMPQWSSSQP